MSNLILKNNEKTKQFEVTPFVKWVGGKSSVIKKHLYKYIPNNFDKYIEPFVGGGAMFFYLQHHDCIINDINSELITTYNQIKTNHNNLMSNLDELYKFRDRESFFKIRENEETDPLKIASRFIYLNKLSFNGMYRVNSKGKFNVPYNNCPNANLYNKENITLMNTFLNSINLEIYNKNYVDVIKMSTKNDFIFCDPPYDYEENKNGFDSYTKSGFNQENQKELANELKKAHHRGSMWMLTNHNTKLINSLYEEFTIIPITTNRFINSDASKRIDTGKEVIIINYQK